MATRGALLVREEEVGTGTEAAGRLEGGADRLAVLVNNTIIEKKTEIVSIYINILKSKHII